MFSLDHVNVTIWPRTDSTGEQWAYTEDLTDWDDQAANAKIASNGI